MAIAPFNYTNTQAATTGTSKALSGGKLVPFNYAAPTPQKPSLATVAGNSLIRGVQQIGGVFKDDTSQILQAFKNSFNLAVSSVDTMTNPSGGTPYQGLQAGLGLAEGVGGVAFSPLAPITNQISKLITAAGNQLANTPYLQGYGKDVVNVPEAQSQNDTTSKILNTAAGFGNVAMAILGAKGLEAKPQPLEAPNGGTGTGTYPPATIRPETPVNEPVAAPIAPKTAPTSGLVGDTSKVAPFTEKTPTEAITTGKEVKVQKTGNPTKAATDINATLVKQGYERLSSELQSKYTPESYKDELVRSKNLTETNYSDAVARATGKKPMGNYEAQILFNEVEKRATQEGDGQTLLDLAKSPHGKALSLAGQTMGAHGFNDNSHSPTEAIQQINKAWEKVTTKGQTTDSVVKRITSKIRKTNTKQTWGDFINELSC